jgi:hypothetical protein
MLKDSLHHRWSFCLRGREQRFSRTLTMEFKITPACNNAVATAYLDAVLQASVRATRTVFICTNGQCPGVAQVGAASKQQLGNTAQVSPASRHQERTPRSLQCRVALW